MLLEIDNSKFKKTRLKNNFIATKIKNKNNNRKTKKKTIIFKDVIQRQYI